MREINLNGYIDEDVWYGDEITPAILHDELYGAEDQYSDDVHIRLNSYGGSCNAATRMFDDIRAYPGNVSITISGTAASAATVIAMAANRLEMTPGSLFMIHNPITAAWGNENDLMEAIQLLKACKESILNCYATRCRMDRNVVAAMMTATTWMDATAARQHGFIDAVTEAPPALSNAEGERHVTRKDAEAKVKAWLDRKRKLSRPETDDTHTAPVSPGSTVEDGQTAPEAKAPESVIPKPEAEDSAPAVSMPETNPGVPADQLHKRLDLIKPIR